MPQRGEAEADTVRDRLDIPSTAPVLLSLSRFVWEKAPEAMLDVFARVRAARPDCYFLIAGADMSDAEEMGDIGRARGLDSHVHLLGVQHDVGALLSCADVFLLPSRVEGFPNAIMEAMAMRLPVVASTVGGIPDSCAPQRGRFPVRAAGGGQHGRKRAGTHGGRRYARPLRRKRAPEGPHRVQLAKTGGPDRRQVWGDP
ncbi:MAG: glycosyltransferase family 4 protein [Desulfovibrio sp.]|nr:glycosyltransferase family 4 protein [Desulfovibrio sp.]